MHSNWRITVLVHLPIGTSQMAVKEQEYIYLPESFVCLRKALVSPYYQLLSVSYLTFLSFNFLICTIYNEDYED